MAELHVGVYTVRLADNPDKVLTVARDSDDDAADVRFEAMRAPSDGQLWAVVRSGLSGDRVRVVNVMSGRALALQSVEDRRADYAAQLRAEYEQRKKEWERRQRLWNAEQDANYRAARKRGGDYSREDFPDGDFMEEELDWPAVAEARFGRYESGWPVRQHDNTAELRASGRATWRPEPVPGAAVRYGGVWFDRWLLVSEAGPNAFGDRWGVLMSATCGADDPDPAYLYDLADDPGRHYAGLIFVPFAWNGNADGAYAYGCPDGAYVIATRMGASGDEKLLGLPANSKENWREVVQVGGTDGADPPTRCVWQLENLSGDELGLCTLRNMYSGSYLCSHDSPALADQPIIQWDSCDGDWAKWHLELLDGYPRDFNGTTRPAWRIRCKSGSNLAIYSGHDGDALNTKTEQVWTVGDVYSAHYLVPTDVVADEIGTPCDVCAADSVGGVPSGEAMADADGVARLWATWRNGSARQKGRWRVKGTAGGDAADVAASVYDGTANAPRALGVTGGDWRDFNGSSSNNGTGDANGGGFEPTVTGGRWWAPSRVEVDVSAGKPVAVEFAVRNVEPDYLGSGLTATGPEVSGTVTVWPAVSASATGCTWSPDGLRVGYALSGGADGASLTVRVTSLKVDGEEALRVPVAVDGAPPRGTVTVPMSALSRVPVDGASVRGALSCGLTHGGESESTFAATVEYSANHGSYLLPEVARTDGMSVEVRLGEHGSADVWYLVGTDAGPAYARADDLGGGAFACYPPLGEACRYYAVAEDDYGWATRTGVLPAVGGDRVDCEIFNWPGGWFRLYMDLEEQSSFSRPVTGIPRQGRLYEDAVPTGPPQLSTPVSGYIHEDPYGDGSAHAPSTQPEPAAGHDGYAAFYELLRQEHVVWRSPRPGWARAVVTGANAPRTRTGRGKVTVTLRTEDPS